MRLPATVLLKNRWEAPSRERDFLCRWCIVRGPRARHGRARLQSVPQDENTEKRYIHYGYATDSPSPALARPAFETATWLDLEPVYRSSLPPDRGWGPGKPMIYIHTRNDTRVTAMGLMPPVHEQVHLACGSATSDR